MDNKISIFLCASGLIVAFLAGNFIIRRRVVFFLGRFGCSLAFPALLIIWIAGATLGQLTGNLAGMSLCGAIVLLMLAVFANNTKSCLNVRKKNNYMNWIAWFVINSIILISSQHDGNQHSAIMGAFLRGNIPPHAFNNPEQLITYHSVFDGIAAILVRALQIDMELARDLLTSILVYALLPCVRILGRLLLNSQISQKTGFLFFLFGMGPTFIRAVQRNDLYQLHGFMVQSYLDIILRRPTALGYLLFALSLIFLLTRLQCFENSQIRSRFLIHPVLLMPVLFLIPLTSEELFIILLPAYLVSWLLGAIPNRWLLPYCFAFLLGAGGSGVIRAMIFDSDSMAHPHVSLIWPPTLPSWEAEDHGVTLFSLKALWLIALELGPLFFVGLMSPLYTSCSKIYRIRSGIAILPFLAGFICAIFLSLGNWPKADLDRFMFYGVSIIFMLGANIFQFLNLSCDNKNNHKFDAKCIAALCIVMVVISGPSVSAAIQAYRHPRGFTSEFFRAEFPGQDLRENLSSVGPRELILTDEKSIAQLLAHAGFSVVAPMNSSGISEITPCFDKWLMMHGNKATWYLLPKSDPRVFGKPAFGHAFDRLLTKYDH